MESEVMSAPFFSRTERIQFGSFHYPLGLVDFTLSATARDALQRIKQGEQISAGDGDEASLTHIAYEITSLFHEMRHFIDMFGTTAGCALFAGHVAQLKSFAAVSKALRSAGMKWKIPLSEWGGEAACPQPIRDFIRRARGFNVGTDLFLCPFKPIEVDGHREDLLVDLDYEHGGQADAFPLRIGRVEEDQEILRTILFPVGLESLMEANAHALSRSLVEHYFPDSISRRLEHRIHTFEISDDDSELDQLAAQTATPYMVVDLLITRYLKQKGISAFPRDLVIASVDRVLSMSSVRLVEIEPGTTAMHVDRVGRMLLDLLEAQEHATLLKGSIGDAPQLTEAYKALLAGLESGGDWESVEDDRSALSSVAIWESYVAKNFIIPLLRERVSSKGRVFTVQSEFLGLINRIGLPPARVANGKLILDVMPQRVQQAWWHQLMLGQILSQLLGGGPIYCPRAFPALPGIETMNLAFERTCNAHIRMGCGTFRDGQKAATTPKCLFEDALRVCALERL
jgi:hypothetical protein